MKITMLAAAALLAFGMGQLPGAPPLKMGLWEGSMVSTMSMAGQPGGMPGMGARTIKVRSCYTAESYAKMLSNTQRQGADCVKTNESMTAKGYSVDMTCAKSNAKGHIEYFFDSRESMHGTVHMDMNPGGHSMTSDMTITNHFVSEDCGSVSPDKPQIQ